MFQKLWSFGLDDTVGLLILDIKYMIIIYRAYLLCTIVYFYSTVYSIIHNTFEYVFEYINRCMM